MSENIIQEGLRKSCLEDLSSKDPSEGKQHKTLLPGHHHRHLLEHYKELLKTMQSKVENMKRIDIVAKKFIDPFHRWWIVCVVKATGNGLVGSKTTSMGHDLSNHVGHWLERRWKCSKPRMSKKKRSSFVLFEWTDRTSFDHWFVPSWFLYVWFMLCLLMKLQWTTLRIQCFSTKCPFVDDRGNRYRSLFKSWILLLH